MTIDYVEYEPGDFRFIFIIRTTCRRHPRTPAPTARRAAAAEAAAAVAAQLDARPIPWNRTKPRHARPRHRHRLPGRLRSGDPELLTLRAYADAERRRALYDHLVSDEVMALLPASVRRIYVGKERDRHTMPQEAINDLLVRHARRSSRAAPEGVATRSSSAAAARRSTRWPRRASRSRSCPHHGALGRVVRGIPLTHAITRSRAVRHGHRKEDGFEMDWQALSRTAPDRVVYMACSAAAMCDGLIAHGMSADTPAACSAGHDARAARDHRTLRTLPQAVADRC